MRIQELRLNSLYPDIERKQELREQLRQKKSL